MERGITLTRLAELAGATVEWSTADTAEMRIGSIGLDTHKLEPGALFAALPGTHVHGATYALQSPAAAVLTDDAGWEILQTDHAAGARQLPVLVVPDVRKILGIVAVEIYGHPSQHLTVLGVTGTSGKTTTSYILERLLMEAGKNVGLIGTTGTRINGRAVPTSLTTPEAPTLQSLFAQMLQEGVTHVVMEVSSHALELGRVTGTDFAVAGFTNLSQDHLDFHPTMEDYFQAKARFFDPESSLVARRAVVCIDDEWGVRMAQLAGPAVVRVGTAQQADADVLGRHIDQDATGAQTVEIQAGEQTWTTHLALPGTFNVANATLALAMAMAVGIDAEACVAAIGKVTVPGRMERIDEEQDFLAVVDYAHKPAAVAAVLQALHTQVDGRIAVVVGCGGDRDASKRPIMGAEAAKGADLVVVTDDNPRSEDPASIRAAVLAGAREAGTDAEIVEEGSRRAAIERAIAWAKPADAVVVVGKGHEVGQIIGDQVLHFDDREEVRRALHERG